MHPETQKVKCRTMYFYPLHLLPLNIFSYFCIMLQDNNTNIRLVSFIITYHDLTGSQIEECINSILGLSLRTEEREIIVIDDGSRQCLLSDIMDTADNIIYIRQPESGTASARNLGMRIATGRYIQFVDGSDKLISEAYDHCIDLARYENPDIVIFNSGTSEKGRNDYEGETSTEGAQYLRHNKLEASPWGYLFAKRLLIDLNFNTTSYAAEDEFTTLLFLRAEKIFSTSAVAYFDRSKKLSAVDRSDKKAVIKRLDDAAAIICRLHDLCDAMPTEDRLALQRRVAELTMNYIINTIRWTRSGKQLTMRVENLEKLGLFPLPDRNYSKKYMLFNKMSRRSIVRKIVCKMLG